MKENSRGSVTPDTKDATAPAIRMPAAYCFFSGFAVWYIANAAAGRPNIITGKNPAWYIPVTPLIPPSAKPQNLLISAIPAMSNQNTAFSA